MPMFLQIWMAIDRLWLYFVGTTLVIRFVAESNENVLSHVLTMVTTGTFVVWMGWWLPVQPVMSGLWRLIFLAVTTAGCALVLVLRFISDREHWVEAVMPVFVLLFVSWQANGGYWCSNALFIETGIGIIAMIVFYHTGRTCDMVAAITGAVSAVAVIAGGYLRWGGETLFLGMSRFGIEGQYVRTVIILLSLSMMALDLSNARDVKMAAIAVLVPIAITVLVVTVILVRRVVADPTSPEGIVVIVSLVLIHCLAISFAGWDGTYAAIGRRGGDGGDG